MWTKATPLLSQLLSLACFLLLGQSRLEAFRLAASRLPLLERLAARRLPATALPR
jgi:hypothetical protein